MEAAMQVRLSGARDGKTRKAGGVGGNKKGQGPAMRCDHQIQWTTHDAHHFREAIHKECN
jgi:hypothetical protein